MVGLARKPKARGGILLDARHLGGSRHCAQFHIKVLYWNTVINGVAATPVMTMLMLLVRRREVLGKFFSSRLAILAWRGVDSRMALCIVGMAISMLIPTTS